MAPLSSGENVAEEAEADLLQRLGEAGKGEAAPDARPGKVGEAELDLRGGGGSGMRALYREAEMTAWRLLGLTKSSSKTGRRDSARSS